MQLNTPQKICFAILLFLFAFWVILFASGVKGGFYNNLWGFLLAPMPLIGGIVAVTRARQWGGFRSTMGKAIFFLGLGAFSWGAGEMMWSYYNFFLSVPVPYPSLADIAYVPSVFFYALGTVYFSQATGFTLAIKKTHAKIFAIMAFIITLLASYYVLIVIARNGVLISPGETPIKVIFDIAYPLGYFVGLMIAIIASGLTFRYLKGRHKTGTVALLLGFVASFISDSLFSYTTATNTYYNGSPVDLLFMINTFLFTFAVLGFYNFHERNMEPSQMGIYGNRVVFTSTTNDFALVVKNRQLAEALRKAFNALKQRWNDGTMPRTHRHPVSPQF